MRYLKQKIKTFFKNKDTSDASVEFLRMWLMPFMKRWDPHAGVDDAIGAFFAVEHRKVYHGNAKRGFKLPGQYMKAGRVPTKRFGPRDVTKGQYMIIVVDKKDQTAKIDINLAGKERTFLLSRAELEFLKDQVEVKEA